MIVQKLRILDWQHNSSIYKSTKVVSKNDVYPSNINPAIDFCYGARF